MCRVGIISALGPLVVACSRTVPARPCPWFPLCGGVSFPCSHMHMGRVSRVLYGLCFCVLSKKSFPVVCEVFFLFILKVHPFRLCLGWSWQGSVQVGSVWCVSPAHMAPTCTPGLRPPRGTCSSSPLTPRTPHGEPSDLPPPWCFPLCSFW